MDTLTTPPGVISRSAKSSLQLFGVRRAVTFVLAVLLGTFLAMGNIGAATAHAAPVGGASASVIGPMPMPDGNGSSDDPEDTDAAEDTGTAQQTQQPAEAASTKDMSFYKLSSSLSSFFGNTMSPDSESESDGFSEEWIEFLKRPGSAGSLLGFPDTDKSNPLKWLSSMISGSSVTYAYESFYTLRDDKGDPAWAPGMVDYAKYGALLSGLGIDSTGSEFSMNFYRMITGGIMILLFLLAGAVDYVFAAVLSILSFLNPFKLFSAGVAAISPGAASALTGGSPMSSDSALAGLVNWVGGWYRVIYDISWTVVIPLTFGLFLASFMFLRNADHGGKLKKLLIRAVFIVVGLPILGGLYTSSVDGMTKATMGGTVSFGATKVVMSTYVDFGGWVNNNRLAPPKNAVLEWDGNNAAPSGNSRAQIRNTALRINDMATGVKGLGDMVSAGNASDVLGNTARWNEETHTKGNTSGEETTDIGAVMRVLMSYSSGDKIDSSAFETTNKSGISAIMDAENREDIASRFEKYSDDKQLAEVEEPRPTENTVISTKGGLSATTPKEGSDKGKTTFSQGSNATCEAESEAKGTDANCNLAPLAMYNYLNTKFDPTQMTVYSSEKAASQATREMHYSVSQIGTGVSQVIYFAHSATLLLSFVLIGFFYAFALLIMNFRRFFELLASVPAAMLGSIAGIAKVITYGIGMVLSVFMTIFLYVIAQEMLLSLSQIVEVPVAEFLSVSLGSVFDGIAAGWLSNIMMIISIILTLWFTFMAMKIRKSVIRSIDEVITKVVERFTGSSITPPNMGGGKGALAGAANGLASAAGMSGANRAMTAEGGAGSNLRSGAGEPGSLGSSGGFVTESANTRGGASGYGSRGGMIAVDGKTNGGNTNGLPGGNDPKNGLPGGDRPNGIQPGPGGASAQLESASAESSSNESDEKSREGENGTPSTETENGSYVVSGEGAPVEGESGVAVGEQVGDESINQSDEDRALAEQVAAKGTLATEEVDQASKSDIATKNSASEKSEREKELGKETGKKAATAAAAGGVAGAAAATGNAAVAKEAGAKAAQSAGEAKNAHAEKKDAREARKAGQSLPQQPNGASTASKEASSPDAKKVMPAKAIATSAKKPVDAKTAAAAAAGGAAGAATSAAANAATKGKAMQNAKKVVPGSAAASTAAVASKAAAKQAPGKTGARSIAIGAKSGTNVPATTAGGKSTQGKPSNGKPATRAVATGGKASAGKPATRAVASGGKTPTSAGRKTASNSLPSRQSPSRQVAGMRQSAAPSKAAVTPGVTKVPTGGRQAAVGATNRVMNTVSTSTNTTNAVSRTQSSEAIRTTTSKSRGANAPRRATRPAGSSSVKSTLKDVASDKLAKRDTD